jgi:very-short-patch-repair endonuclease
MHSRKRPVDALIARIAARQYGTIARRQLRMLGLDEAAIDNRVWSGRLHVLHMGVYAVGHSHLDRRGRLMAATLAFPEGAVLSHRTAAEEWRILRPTSIRPNVTSDERTLHGQPGIVLHRVRSLDPALRAEVNGLPVTTVERVLLDLAVARDLTPLKRAWEGAQREGLLDVDKVIELIGNSPGRRVKPLKALIAAAVDAPDTRSEFEDLFTDFLVKYGLPIAHRNVVIEGYIVDAHFPGTGLIIELDGERWHWNRREEDVERDADLHLADYRVYRVTWHALTRKPDMVAAKIRRFLEQTRRPQLVA